MLGSQENSSGGDPPIWVKTLATVSHLSLLMDSHCWLLLPPCPGLLHSSLLPPPALPGFHHVLEQVGLGLLNKFLTSSTDFWAESLMIVKDRTNEFFGNSSQYFYSLNLALCLDFFLKVFLLPICFFYEKNVSFFYAFSSLLDPVCFSKE